ncbi:MAG: diacylglycerol/lipid kinase family protein [Anaerolineae bacterium]
MGDNRMPEARLIVNPVAGRGYASRVQTHVCRIMEGLGLSHSVCQTERPLQAIELAEEASQAGYSPVVAVGGDGTVHEVLNGLVRAHVNGGPVGTMAVIPAGSGNDFEYMLQAAGSLEAACRRIAERKTKLIDVGRVDDRYFANGVGIGFDATVNIVSRRHRTLRGLPLYLLSALETIFIYYKAPLVTVNIDEQEIKGRMLMVGISNGRRIGGGFMIAPAAEIDDGLFDICLARQASRRRILALLPEFIRGTHVRQKEVRMLRGRRVVVTSEEGLPSHVDGEIYTRAARRLEMELLRQRLRVVVS